MQFVPACFGLACLGAAALTRFSDPKDRGDAIFLGVVLVASWAASNVGWGHGRIDLYPLMDGPILALATIIYRLRGGEWRYWFHSLAGGQMGLHLVYILCGDRYIVPYLYALDLTFAAEILVVGWGGGRNVVVAVRSKFRSLRDTLSFRLVQKVRA